MIPGPFYTMHHLGPMRIVPLHQAATAGKRSSIKDLVLKVIGISCSPESGHQGGRGEEVGLILASSQIPIIDIPAQNRLQYQYAERTPHPAAR